MLRQTAAESTLPLAAIRKILHMFPYDVGLFDTASPANRFQQPINLMSLGFTCHLLAITAAIVTAMPASSTCMPRSKDTTT